MNGNDFLEIAETQAEHIVADWNQYELEIDDLPAEELDEIPDWYIDQWCQSYCENAPDDYRLEEEHARREDRKNDM